MTTATQASREIEIKGATYAVEAIPAGDLGVSAVRMTKLVSGEGYEVVRHQDGHISCDCPSYAHTYEGTSGTCKHGTACMIHGLLPVAPAVAVVEPAAPKADRIINRAPKGGAVSPVNNRWYRGGCFMPTVATDAEVKPATLEGSYRQVSWATRLRSEAIDRLAHDIEVRRASLSGGKLADEAEARRAIRRDSLALNGLMVERSASRVIEMRAELVG